MDTISDIIVDEGLGDIMPEMDQERKSQLPDKIVHITLEAPGTTKKKKSVLIM